MKWNRASQAANTAKKNGLLVMRGQTRANSFLNSVIWSGDITPNQGFSQPLLMVLSACHCMSDDANAIPTSYIVTIHSQQVLISNGLRGVSGIQRKSTVSRKR